MALAAAVFCLLALAALHLGLRTPFLTLLGAVLLAAACAEFWLPVTFELDDRGASRATPLGRRQVAWAEVRAARQFDAGPRPGVLLSTVPGANGIAAAWRAVFLPVGREGAPSLDELVAQVAARATARHRPEPTDA